MRIVVCKLVPGQSYAQNNSLTCRASNVCGYECCWDVKTNRTLDSFVYSALFHTGVAKALGPKVPEEDVQVLSGSLRRFGTKGGN